MLLLDIIQRARTRPQKPVSQEDYFSQAITLGDTVRGRTTSFSPTDARDIASFVSVTAVCAGRVANMCAQVPLRLYKPKRSKGGNVTRAQKRWLRDSTPNGPGRKAAQQAQRAEELEEIEEHPLLDLLKDPSGFSTGLSSAEIRFLNKALTGNSYTLKIRPSRNAPPTELYDLSPAWTTILPSKESFIEGFRYGRDTTASRVHAPEDIIHGIEMQDPQIPYRGRGVMSAILGEHQLYLAVNQKQLVFMDNQARPDMVISTKEGTTAEQIKQLRDRIYAQLKGVAKTGNFLITPEATVTPMQFPQKDMGEIEWLRYTATIIAGAFGVAESDIFLNSANLASAEVGARQTARVAINPRLQKDSATLNERLLPDFDDLERAGAWLAYDNPVAEDDAAKSNKLSVAVGKWMTVNEARSEDGLEPLEGEEFDTIRSVQPMGGGFTAGDNPTDTAKEPENGKGDAEKNPAGDDAKETSTAGDKPADAEGSKASGTGSGVAAPAAEVVLCKLPVSPKSMKSIAAAHEAVWIKEAPTLHPEGDENEPVDVRWYRGLRTAFYNQETAILMRMDAAQFGLSARTYRKAAYTPEVIASMLAAWGIDDPKQWDRMLLEPTIGYVREAVTVGATVGIDEAKRAGWKPGNPDSFYTSSAYVTRAAQERSLGYTQSIQGVNETTAAKLREAIVGGLERGDSLHKMKEAVKESFSGLTESGVTISDSRAATIARTESVRSQGQGRIAGWRATEAVKGKTFLLAPGSCQFCEAVATEAGEKVIPIDDYFVPLGKVIAGADGGTMVNDYEPTDNPHPNCRCATQPVLMEEV